MSGLPADSLVPRLVGETEEEELQRWATGLPPVIAQRGAEWLQRRPPGWQRPAEPSWTQLRH